MGLKKTAFFLSITLSVVLLFGCSDTHKQASPNDTFSDELPKETVSASGSIDDQVRAEQLLRSAQLHIEGSRKLRAKNPKQGIEDARRVIREYPGTAYSQKALELLRRVPDRWKKLHNITDEELGLIQETVAESAGEEKQAEPVKETADQNTASRQDSEAQQKLMFAKNNLKLAQKGILGYSQVVAQCRGVIADFPGTEYEQEAREILQQIPEDQRDRYKLTDQELGLQNGNE